MNTSETVESPSCRASAGPTCSQDVVEPPQQDGFRVCPFCGLHDQLVDECGDVNGEMTMLQVNCLACGVRGPVAWNEEDARRYWNERLSQLDPVLREE